MMNKFLFILFAVVGLVSMTSCSETDEDNAEYAGWQTRNDAFFAQWYQRAVDSVAANPAKWKLIKSYTKDTGVQGAPTDYIIVRVISQKNAHDENAEILAMESPIFTDSVRVHYRGNLIPSPSYSVPSPSFEKVGFQFTTSWFGEYNPLIMIPAKFAVNGLVDGFSTALQHMHVGDRWEVCLPYQLGYSDKETDATPAYSVLVFDITLHSFWHPGDRVPAFQ